MHRGVNDAVGTVENSVEGRSVTSHNSCYGNFETPAVAKSFHDEYYFYTFWMPPEIQFHADNLLGNS